MSMIFKKRVKYYEMYGRLEFVRNKSKKFFLHFENMMLLYKRNKNLIYLGRWSLENIQKFPFYFVHRKGMVSNHG